MWKKSERGGKTKNYGKVENVEKEIVINIEKIKKSLETEKYWGTLRCRNMWKIPKKLKYAEICRKSWKILTKLKYFEMSK